MYNILYMHEVQNVELMISCKNYSIVMDVINFYLKFISYLKKDIFFFLQIM